MRKLFAIFLVLAFLVQSVVAQPSQFVYRTYSQRLISDALHVFEPQIGVRYGGALKPQTNTLLTSLVAFWKLDEASGTRNDAFSTNHLTDNNTVTQAAGIGGVGNAAQFTKANSEYLSIASNAAVQTGDIDFTISLWVYLDAKSTNMGFYCKDDNTSGNREFILYYELSSNRFGFYVFRATDSVQLVLANNLGSPSLSTWYHIIAWHDATANTINISVNNGTANSTNTGGALQSAGTAALSVGRHGYPAFERPLDGRMQYVGFWKKVLSADERTQLNNSGAGYSPV